MKKVSPFEVAGAVEQAGRGHIPEVDGPKAERQDRAVGAQAPRGGSRQIADANIRSAYNNGVLEWIAKGQGFW